jgi:hypothetical protein
MYITVGALVNAINDPEGFAYEQSNFKLLNRALKAAGLPEHKEPCTTKQLTPWSVRAYDWNVGMNYLCRLAVYLWDGQPLPPPGDPAVVPLPENEPLMDEYLSIFMGDSKANEHRFNHLLLHRIGSGYYVPLEFEEVVYPQGKLFDDVGGMIGSSVVLKRELEVLAGELKLALDLDPDSRELWDLAQEQGSNKRRRGWRRYGLESIACVQLYHACMHSVENRAAIVFNA